MHWPADSGLLLAFLFVQVQYSHQKTPYGCCGGNNILV
jgi:hypothetical protein